MAGYNNDYQTEEISIDLFDIIRDVLRDWWLILIMGATAAMCAYMIVSVTYQPSYSSYATFVVTSKGSNDIYGNLDAANTVAMSLTKIFDSGILKKKVIEDIGMDKLSGEIYAEVIPETNLFTLTVSAQRAEESYQIITSVMRNYTTVTNHIFGNAILDILEEPELPMYPDNPIDTYYAMKLAGWVSMAAVAALLIALSIMRDTVKNEKEVTKKLDTKLFGTIYHENKYKTLRSRLSRKKKSILITSPTVSFPFVENFKKIRSKLEYQTSHKSYNAILVTSVLENEGKSTVSINLALSLALKNKNVLLIDADFRKPSIHKILQKKIEVDREIGDSILNNESLKDVITFDENSGLYLAIGSKRYDNSAGIISKESFREFINASKKVMDYIIIDSPPMSVSADTEMLAEYTDVSLLVVRQSTAFTKDINDSIDVLSGSNSELLGCIYNNVRTSLFGHRTSYGNKYSYEGYYSKAEKRPAKGA